MFSVVSVVSSTTTSLPSVVSVVSSTTTSLFSAVSVVPSTTTSLPSIVSVVSSTTTPLFSVVSVVSSTTTSLFSVNLLSNSIFSFKFLSSNFFLSSICLLYNSSILSCNPCSNFNLSCSNAYFSIKSAFLIFSWYCSSYACLSSSIVSVNSLSCCLCLASNSLSACCWVDSKLRYSSVAFTPSSIFRLSTYSCISVSASSTNTLSSVLLENCSLSSTLPR